MNSPRTFFLLGVALFILCFSLGANLTPRFRMIEYERHQSNNFFNLLLGDSSRMFAKSFFVEADSYYHSGYYPSIFDNNSAFKTPHIAEDTGAVSSKNHGEETGFMGPPRDWLDAFGRHFIPDRHTHLDEGGASGDLSGSKEVAEILPWLKLAAELDPNNVETYTVTAFWLQRLHQDKQAEQVLREGLRENPQSYDILFALGQVYNKSYHDPEQAKNVWELAAKYWLKLSDDDKKNNKLIFEQIASNLAQVEENAGHLSKAIHWFQEAQTVSKIPAVLQERIDEDKAKMAAGTNTPAATPH